MDIYRLPWKLVQNKIVRYPGGREIDRFRGIEPPQDDGRPEAWVGSDTRTVNAPDTGDENDGCSRCVLPDGRECYLFEAIGENPKAALGEEHIAINGERMGLLVKLLDAQRQLGLQTHPTRPYAKAHFGSDYGKEESWYIIGLREDAEEPPYVLLGFKEDATREKFEAGYDAGDISAMEKCCHKVPVQAGDLFFIAAGVPHAIGPGCFLVEVQEPSDITVGAAKPRKPLPPEEAERYKQRLLDCYIYNGSSYEENLSRYKIPPRLIREGDWGRETLLIGPEQTDYFSFTRIDARKETALLHTGFPQTVIVLEGDAVLLGENTRQQVKKADELFFPASVEPLSLLPGKEGVSLVLCNPGRVDVRAIAKA